MWVQVFAFETVMHSTEKYRAERRLWRAIGFVSLDYRKQTFVS